MELTVPQVIEGRKTGLLTRNNVRVKLCKDTGTLIMMDTTDAVSTYSISQFCKRKLHERGTTVTLTFDTAHPTYKELPTPTPNMLKFVIGEDTAMRDNFIYALTNAMEEFCIGTKKTKVTKAVINANVVKPCSYIRSTSSAQSQRSESSSSQNQRPVSVETNRFESKPNTPKSTSIPEKLQSTVNALYPESKKSSIKPMDTLENLSSPLERSSDNFRITRSRTQFHDMPDVSKSRLHESSADRSTDTPGKLIDLEKKKNTTRPIYGTPRKRRNNDEELSAPSIRPSTLPSNLFQSATKSSDDAYKEDSGVMPERRTRYQNLRARTPSSASPPKPTDFDHRKLKNIGNSCYSNAMLQALSTLHPFTFKFKQAYQLIFVHKSALIKKGNPQRIELFKSLTDILHILSRNMCDGRPLFHGRQYPRVEREKLEELHKCFGKLRSSFDNGKQQDAHEYWMYLIEEVDNLLFLIAKHLWAEMNYVTTEKDSDQKLLFGTRSTMWNLNPIRLFEIKTEARTVCDACNAEKIKIEIQNDLALDLKENHTLQELVDTAFPCSKRESQCEKCGFKNMRVSSRIVKFPEVLAVTMKRYHIDPILGPVKCDAVIPIDPFLYTHALVNFQEETMSEMEEEYEAARTTVTDKSNIESISAAATPSFSTLKLSNNYCEKITDEVEQDDVADSEMTIGRCDSNDYITPPRADDIDVGIKRRSSMRKSHVDLFCANDVKKSTSEFQSEFGSKESTDGKLLGGAKKGSDDDEDWKETRKKKTKASPKKIRQASEELEIIEERVSETISFAPLVDFDEVKSILEKCKIKFADSDLRKHLDSFPMPVDCEIDVKKAPTKIKFVSPDGNCFYRAVSWWLTGSQLSHEALRVMNAALMTLHKDLFAKLTHLDIGAHIRKAECRNEWANEVDIISMCTLLNTDIYTFLGGRWIRYQPKVINGAEGPKPVSGCIYLTNKDNCHFNVVLACHPLKNPYIPSKSRKRPSSNSNPGSSDEEEDERPFKKDKKSSPEEPKRRPRLPRQCNEKHPQEEEQGSHNNLKIDWAAASDSPVYKLMSVVCHQGKSLADGDGHYVAYTRNDIADNWTYCSDENVSSVSESTVLLDTAQDGYLLYYTRVRNPE